MMNEDENALSSQCPYCKNNIASKSKICPFCNNEMGNHSRYLYGVISFIFGSLSIIFNPFLISTMFFEIFENNDSISLFSAFFTPIAFIISFCFGAKSNHNIMTKIGILTSTISLTTYVFLMALFLILAIT